MIARLLDRLRRDGPRVTARAILHRVRKYAYLHEEHVWYQCDLSGARPRRELPRQARLVHAEPPQIDALQQLGQSSDEALERLHEGNDIWMVLDGGEPLFSCCTFRRVAPVSAASHGTLTLPEGAACLEDSVTSAAARGRGIAPGAWTLICDELHQDGFTTLVTKIETDNAASRRAVEKVGFRPVAVMDHHRVALRSRTAVRPLGKGLGDELVARLT